MIKTLGSISTERDPIRLSGFKGDAVKVLIEMNLNSEQFMQLKELIGESFTVILSKEDFEIINN